MATPTPPVASPPAPEFSTPPPAPRWPRSKSSRSPGTAGATATRTSTTGVSPSPPTTTASTRPCRPEAGGTRPGDLAARRVETLKENVECPSLSPDGSRVAFKEAVDADPTKGWRLSVLDLATLRVTATAETRSVDDQAAWLDGETMAYTLRKDDGQPDVWSIRADGSGTPKLVIPGAESPSPLS
ncbi:hypothetical protein NKG94_21030 [Micromonospora sp. M12]